MASKLYQIILSANIDNQSIKNVEEQIQQISNKFGTLTLDINIDGKNIKNAESLLENINAITERQNKSVKDQKQTMRGLVKETENLQKAQKKTERGTDKYTEKTTHGTAFGSDSTVVRGKGDEKTITDDVVRDYKRVQTEYDKIINKAREWQHVNEDVKQSVIEKADQFRDASFDQNSGLELGSQEHQNRYNQLTDQVAQVARQEKELAQISNQAQRDKNEWIKKANQLREKGLLTEKEISQFQQQANNLSTEVDQSSLDKQNESIRSMYNDRLQRQREIAQEQKELERVSIQAEKDKNNWIKKANQLREQGLLTQKEIAQVEQKAQGMSTNVDGKQNQSQNQEMEALYGRMANKQNELMSIERNHANLQKESQKTINTLKEQEIYSAREIQKIETQLKNTGDARTMETYDKRKNAVQEELQTMQQVSQQTLEMSRGREESQAKIRQEQQQAILAQRNAQQENTKIESEQRRQLAEQMGNYREQSEARVANERQKNMEAQRNAIQENAKIELEQQRQLAQEMGKVREQSEARVKKETSDHDLKQQQAINAELERQEGNLQKINEAKAQMEQRVDALQQKGIIDEGEVQRVRSSFDSISKDTTNLSHDLSNANNHLKGLEQTTKQGEANMAKIRNEAIKFNQTVDRLRNNQFISDDEVNRVVHQFNSLGAETTDINGEIKDINNQLSMMEGRAKKATDAMRKPETSNLSVDWDSIGGGGIDERQERLADQLTESLNRLHGSAGKVKRQFVAVQPAFDRAGNEIYKVNYSVDQGRNGFKNYGLELDRTNRKVRQLGQNMKQAQGATKTLTQLGNALQRVPLWASISTVFYGGFRQARQGITDIMEINKAMIQLEKVTESTKNEFANFREEANKIGSRLGALTEDVIRATTEFSRLGYTLEESAMLAENALMFSNVGNMSIEDSYSGIISMMKGFDVEVTNSGESIREMVDIVNEVGNNFAISQQGIGEALKRSSAMLYASGNTIEEATSLVTAANTTIQDPKKVGTALKTISMRLRGVNEDGQSVIGLVPQLEQTFNNFGGTIMKNATEFKNTFEIMQEVKDHWEDLTDIEQANLVELMGGKRQGTIVSAMVQNWDDAEGALQTAMTSMGSASREFDVYKTGLEHQVNALKTEMQGFWESFWNEDVFNTAIKGFRDLISIMGRLQGTVGTLPMITAGMVTLMAMFTKGFQGMNVQLASGVGMLTVMKGLVATIGRGLKIFGALTLPLMAVSFVAEKIYSSVQKTRLEEERRLDLLKQQNNELSQQLEEVESTVDMDRFSQLAKSNERGDLGVRERQELLDIQENLSRIMPEVISHYDDERDAVYKTTGQIQKLLDVKQKELYQSEMQTARLGIQEVDYGAFEDAIDEYKGFQEDLEKEKEKAEAFNLLENFVKNSSMDSNIEGEEFLKEVDKFVEEITDRFDNREITEQMEHFVSGIGFDTMFGDFDKQKVLDDLNDLITLPLEETQENIRQLMSMEDFDIENQLKDIESYVMRFAHNFALDNDLSANAQMFFNNLASSAVNAYDDIMQIEDIDIEEYFNNLPNQIVEIEEMIRDSDVSIDDLFSFDDEDVFDEAIEELQNYKNEADLTEKEVIILTSAIETMTSSYADNVQAVRENADAEADHQQSLMDTAEAYNELSGEISSINKFLDDYNEAGKLTAESLGELIDLHPELLEYLHDEELLIQKLIEKRDDKANAMQEQLLHQLQSNEAFWDAMVEGNEGMMRDIITGFSGLFGNMETFYENDFKNAKSLADAKARLETHLINELSKKWGEYYRVQTENFSKTYREMNKHGALNAEHAELANDVAHFATVTKQASVALDGIGFDTIDSGLDFQGIGSDRSSSGGSSSRSPSSGRSSRGSSDTDSSAKEEERDNKSLLDSLIRVANAKSDILSIEEEHLEFLKEKAEFEKDYEKQIELTSKTLDNQYKQIEEIKTSKKQISRIADEVRRNTQFSNTDSWFDHNNEKTITFINRYNNASVEQQEEMQAVFDDLQKLKNAYAENNKELVDLQAQIRNTSRSLGELKIEQIRFGLEKVKHEISVSTSLLSRYDEGTKKYIETTEEIIRRLEDKYVLLRREEQQIRDNIKSVRGNADETEYWTEKLRENTLAQHENRNSIISHEDNLKSTIEGIANDVVNIYKDMYRKQKDEALGVIDDELKALEDAHKKKMDMLDEELDKYNEIVDERLKALDDEWSEDDFDREISKHQEEQAKIRERINKLALDDSIESQAKRRDLEEQYDNIERDIEDRRRNRKRDLQRKSLNDLKEQKREEIEEERESSEFMVELNGKQYEVSLEKGRELLEKQKEQWDQHYEDLINNEREFSKIREDILEGHLDEVMNDFDGFGIFLDDNMEDIGKSITENFIDKIAEAKEALKSIGDASSDSLGQVDKNIENTTRRMKENSAEYFNADRERQHYLHAENKRLGESIGAEFNEDDHRWYKDGKLLYGHGEFIDQMQENSQNYHGASNSEKTELRQENRRIGSKIGASFDDTTGLWFSSDGDPLYGLGYVVDIMKENSEKYHSASNEEKARLHQQNQELGESIGAEFNTDDYRWYKDGERLYHDGGIVGGKTNKIGQVVDKMFNTKPNEKVVKSLIGELQIPSENISKNFVPNVKGMISSFSGERQNSVSENHYNFDINIESVQGGESGANDLFRHINRKIKSRGGL